MDEIKRNYITGMLKQHEEFIVIGLTGRIGSGCSDAAKIFGASFADLDLPAIYPGDKGLVTNDERDRRILYRYATHHWLKFDIIKVRTIITSFLLDVFDDFCNEIADKIPEQEINGEDVQKTIIIKARENMAQNKSENESLNEQVQFIHQTIDSSDLKNQNSKGDSLIDRWRNAKEKIDNGILKFDEVSDFDDNILDANDIGKFFIEIYEAADAAPHYANRKEWLKLADALLEGLSSNIAIQWWDIYIGNLENSIQITEKLKKIGDYLYDWKKSNKMNFYSFILVHDILPAFSSAIHDYILEQKSSLYTELYQKYGNYIRAFGRLSSDIMHKGKDDSLEIAGNIESTFEIPRRVNQFIKSLRHPFNRFFPKPTRVVIDSIKNIFEATYLRERYSAFYLFAISADDNVRIERLMERNNLTRREIAYIDWNEYSNYGAEKYQRFITEKDRMNLNIVECYKQLIRRKVFSVDEIDFIKRVNGDVTEEKEQVIDLVRKNAYKNKIYQFVLQDVGSSIQNADVFISNNHRGETKNKKLQWEIVRNVSLIMYPGLLMPTPIERCMQEAFTAKANSGCLSRQVGAVVTDKEYNILSIGWNDVPYCDISCARKNLCDVCKQDDVQAYSEFELKDKEFQDRIQSIYEKTFKKKSDTSLGKLLCGLPWSYCFKDVHIETKQPMRSRAMHAEEKALANVMEKAIGGCLFTTSSPCEMCSKNAKNHQIKKIYYIEPYPGISEEQYTQSGDYNNRAEHILFTGAIGRAYTQMYLPIMPHKDVLAFLGIETD